MLPSAGHLILPCLLFGYFSRQIVHSYVRSTTQINCWKIGDRVVRLREPTSSTSSSCSVVAQAGPASPASLDSRWRKLSNVQIVDHLVSITIMISNFNNGYRYRISDIEYQISEIRISDIVDSNVRYQRFECLILDIRYSNVGYRRSDIEYLIFDI